MLKTRKSAPRGAKQPSTQPPPLQPTHRRWFFARDAMRKWKKVFDIMEMDPEIHLMNPTAAFGRKTTMRNLEAIFLQPLGGSTPMTETLWSALTHRSVLDARSASRGCGGYDFGQPSSQPKPRLIIGITDGEANDMKSFAALLDHCQNGHFGDVQICLLGLSLVKEDIEWFEMEECYETRIRTIEPYEVEINQILMREVVSKEDGYNFDMHTYRALVTNFFPADYDYEAPLQNLRHRLYITCHGRDRWWGMKNCSWYGACTTCFCPGCFVVTGCHCCGWCQGQECGKCEYPECIQDSCCAEGKE